MGVLASKHSNFKFVWQRENGIVRRCLDHSFIECNSFHGQMYSAAEHHWRSYTADSYYLPAAETSTEEDLKEYSSSDIFDLNTY